MHADRFVTLCFLYCGLVLCVQYLVVFGAPLQPAGLAQLGVALSILGAGVVRLIRPEVEADNPAAFGGFVYFMAALTAVLTIIVLAQVIIL